MLVGCVIQDEIDENPYAALLGLCDQPIPILQRSVFRGDVCVIRNIVAEIHIWRWEKWRDPDRVHTQLLDVVQSRRNSIQIADPI